MSYGQTEYAISLENERIIDFKKREFFISNVIDKSNNAVFTYSKLGSNRQIRVLEYDTDLQSEVKFLLLKSLPEKKNQIGLTLVIDALKSTEDYGEKGEELKITFQAKLLFEDEVLYTNRHEKVFSNAKSYKEYPVFIAQTIQGFIYDFAMISDEANPAKSVQINEAPIEETTSDNKQEKLLQENESRDVVAVGYQIGGFSLVGVNYEFRATDVLGIHAGVGFMGYTAGVKLHFKPTKDGGFINASFKDGGFGLIKAYAVEYGSRRAFSKRKGSFGFHYQIGLAMVTEIDPDLSRILGSSEDPPFIMLSLGVGFSW